MAEKRNCVVDSCLARGKRLSMYRFEASLIREGYRIIAGADEAGMGPLAGPVVAACVILPSKRIAGINDSKLLSEKKREALFPRIMNEAQVGIGVVSETIIDQINIYQAGRRAILEAFHKLPQMPEYLLVDGRMKLDVACRYRAIVKGDRKSASIAAASIVAKVTRDRMMKEFDREFPQYEFAQHKGYCTRRHWQLLKIFGPSPIHRKSFAPVREHSFEIEAHEKFAVLS
ncbi:MAG: ribonuclease HII [Candidatus Omnitrophica bacterium]|nr:ribonuclease HII [Candidatus Omnitrophota bacterium]